MHCAIKALLTGKIMKFFKFFKRRYPYAPIAFLGRKNVEKMLGADIKKLKKLDAEKAKQKDE